MKMTTDIYLVPRFVVCDVLIPFHTTPSLHAAYVQDQKIIKHMLHAC